MAGKSAILKVNILADAAKAVQGLNRTESALGKLSKVAGGAALAAGGAALVGFGVNAVKAAGDLQQSAGAISTVFGKSAADMLKWSTEAATSVGLTQNEFNELGTLIGSQLKNGGTAMDQLAPKTNQLIGLGADLSSMFGGSTKEAVEALSSALKGERDPIERYGVSLNQAKIDAEAAALGFTKVGGALSTEAQQAATLSLIMKQTGDAHGNFAKESNTLAGQQQRAAAQWQNITAQIGGFFLPIVTQAFGFINAHVLPAIEAFTSRLGDGGLAGAFGGLGPAIQAVTTILSPMSLVWQALVPLFPQIVAAIAPLAGQLLPVLSGLFAALVPVVAQLIATIAPLAAQLVGQLVPVIVQLVGSVLPPLAGLFTTVATALLPLAMTLLPVVGQLFTTLAPVIAAVVAAVAPLVAQLATALVPIIGQLVSTVLPPVIQIFGSVIASIMPLVSTLATLLVPAIQSLMPVVQTVFGLVETVVRTVMGVVQGIITTATGLITGDWEMAWSGVSHIFDSVLNGIGDFARQFFGELPGNILAWLGDVGNLLLGAGEAILEGFLSGLRNAWGAVTDFVGGIASWIAENKGPLSYDRRLLEPAGAAIMGGLQRSMERQMPKLKRFLGDVTGTIAGIGTDAGDVNLTATGGRAARTAGRPVHITVRFEGLVTDKVGVAREIRNVLRDADRLAGVA